MAQEEGLGAGLPQRMNWDELILAYAAGELSSEDEPAVEQYLATHPELADKVALYWSLRLLVAQNQLENPSVRAIGRTKAIFGRGVNRPPAGETIHTLARWLRARAPVIVVMILGLFILALSFGVTTVSSASPGQDLYPIKRSVESLELALTLHPSQKAELNLRLAQIRVQEINDLVARKQYHLLPEPFSAFKSHVENAVRGLGSVPGDQPAHFETAAHLEETLEKIGSSLAQLSESSPLEVKEDVAQAIIKTRAATAFIHAERALVINDEVGKLPSIVPSSGDDEAAQSSPVPQEPSTQASEPPIATLPIVAESLTPITLQTAATATFKSITRVQGSTTPTLSLTPTGTPTLAAATLSNNPSTTPSQTTTFTSVPTSQATPTAGNSTIPSATATHVTPSSTAIPTSTATSFVPTATVVTTTPTIIVKTHTPLPSNTPTATAIPASETPVPTLTATDIAATDTPMPTETPTATDIPAADTPMPTETPTEIPATDTPMPTETPTEIPATETLVPTDPIAEIELTDTPTPTETPTATDIPATDSPIPTETPTDIPATETPVPTDPIAEIELTDTPVPTETPTETPAPTEIFAESPTETHRPTETPTTQETGQAAVGASRSALRSTLILEIETPSPIEMPLGNGLQFEHWVQLFPFRWYSFDLINVLSGILAR